MKSTPPPSSRRPVGATRGQSRSRSPPPPSSASPLAAAGGSRRQPRADADEGGGKVFGRVSSLGTDLGFQAAALVAWAAPSQRRAAGAGVGAASPRLRWWRGGSGLGRRVLGPPRPSSPDLKTVSRRLLQPPLCQVRPDLVVGCVDVEWVLWIRVTPWPPAAATATSSAALRALLSFLKAALRFTSPSSPFPCIRVSPQLWFGRWWRHGGVVTFLKAPFWVCGEAGRLLRASGAPGGGGFSFRW